MFWNILTISFDSCASIDIISFCQQFVSYFLKYLPNFSSFFSLFYIFLKIISAYLAEPNFLIICKMFHFFIATFYEFLLWVLSRVPHYQFSASFVKEYFSKFYFIFRHNILRYLLSWHRSKYCHCFAWRRHFEGNTHAVCYLI